MYLKWMQYAVISIIITCVLIFFLRYNMSSPSILPAGSGNKDIVIVASREELSTPSRVSLPDPEPTPGLILADGSINWGCPCLGGMATGPCGIQFREAFSCFHYRFVFQFFDQYISAHYLFQQFKRQLPHIL